MIWGKATLGDSELGIYPTLETHVNEKSYMDETKLYPKDRWALTHLILSAAQNWVLCVSSTYRGGTWDRPGEMAK